MKYVYDLSKYHPIYMTINYETLGIYSSYDAAKAAGNSYIHHYNYTSLKDRQWIKMNNSSWRIGEDEEDGWIFYIFKRVIDHRSWERNNDKE